MVIEDHSPIFPSAPQTAAFARKRMTGPGTGGEDIFIAVRLLFKLFRIAFASVAAAVRGPLEYYII